MSTLQRANTENLKQIFPEKELRGHSPNFHIHVSVSDLYIPSIGPHISCSRIDKSIVEIYESLTDTWMWKLGLRLRNSQKRNTLMGYSLQCTVLKGSKKTTYKIFNWDITHSTYQRAVLLTMNAHKLVLCHSTLFSVCSWRGTAASALSRNPGASLLPCSVSDVFSASTHHVGCAQMAGGRSPPSPSSSSL